MTDEQKRKVEHRMDSTLYELAMDGAKGSFLMREDFWRRLWLVIDEETKEGKKSHE